MHPRIRPLTLAVLLTATGLSATGCVSVPATPRPPAPGIGPAGAPSPSPAGPEHRAEQAPARGELASTGPEKSPRPRPAGAGEADDGGPGGAPEPGRAEIRGAHDGQVAAPQRRARERRDTAPAEKAALPHGHGKHPAARAPRTRTDYGMGDLCRFSEGVADPAFVAMCRANYGR